MDFYQFQRDAKRTSKLNIQDPRELATYCALGMQSHLGAISGQLCKGVRDGDDYTNLPEDLRGRLGHILWYMALMAGAYKISFQTVAKENLNFNQRRWPSDWDSQSDSPLVAFDVDEPPGQQLPSKIWAEFLVCHEDDIEKVRVRVYPDLSEPPVEFGDPIDNNAWDKTDSYHFHDIYHFAYVVFLGWSPVVRKLLDCKRKDEQGGGDIDRIEDGARARDTEEAITSFIYTYLSRQTVSEGLQHLDTGLLTTVRFLCRDLEVSSRDEKEWEKCILSAAKIQRRLVDNNGGWVVVDRENATLKFEATKPTLGEGT